MYEVIVEQTFAAAHALRNYHGSCEKTHGHNFKVEVTVAGKTVDEAGMMLDFLDLKRYMNQVVMRLDHTFLNEIEPFTTISPSAENIAKHIFEELGKLAPVSRVRVWETNEMSAVYYE
jgi:6-pyruvoyltetrahydropterin/6-carboxytetrahydropterin synthase